MNLQERLQQLAQAAPESSQPSDTEASSQELEKMSSKSKA